MWAADKEGSCWALNSSNKNELSIVMYFKVIYLVWLASTPQTNLTSIHLDTNWDPRFQADQSWNVLSHHAKWSGLSKETNQSTFKVDQIAPGVMATLNRTLLRGDKLQW